MSQMMMCACLDMQDMHGSNAQVRSRGLYVHVALCWVDAAGMCCCAHAHRDGLIILQQLRGGPAALNHVVHLDVHF
jgi:hypothetical protein